MVGGGVWLWWAYRTYDICTLLSLQYLGREGGGGLVGNNTLQLKFSSICFYCIISSKPWGGGGKLFRERVYNIFIYTQLFRVKNFSSICLYCIIVSVDIQGARGIAARFLKWSPASTVCPIMTKFSQYTPHSTCYLVLMSICRQD
jgi:hypothetical protein